MKKRRVFGNCPVVDSTGGATPQEDLPREIDEEMGLTVTKIADNPSYFITDQTMNRKAWIVYVKGTPFIRQQF